MKKICTLMFLFACSMILSVSCSNDKESTDNASMYSELLSIKQNSNLTFASYFPYGLGTDSMVFDLPGRKAITRGEPDPDKPSEILIFDDVNLEMIPLNCQPYVKGFQKLQRNGINQALSAIAIDPLLTYNEKEAFAEFLGVYELVLSDLPALAANDVECTDEFLQKQKELIEAFTLRGGIYALLGYNLELYYETYSCYRGANVAWETFKRCAE